MARDADPVFDLWVSVVEISGWYWRPAHQIELITEVQERLSALRPKLPLPSFRFLNDCPCLVHLIPADIDLFAGQEPHACAGQSHLLALPLQSVLRQTNRDRRDG